MIGRILGEVLAAPIRIANVPMKMVDRLKPDDVADVSAPLDALAELVEGSVKDAFDEGED